MEKAKALNGTFTESWGGRFNKNKDFIWAWVDCPHCHREEEVVAPTVLAEVMFASKCENNVDKFYTTIVYSPTED